MLAYTERILTGRVVVRYVVVYDSTILRPTVNTMMPLAGQALFQLVAAQPGTMTLSAPAAKFKATITVTAASTANVPDQDQREATATIQKYYLALNQGDFDTTYNLLTHALQSYSKSQADYKNTLTGWYRSVKVTQMKLVGASASTPGGLVYQMNLEIRAGPKPSPENPCQNLRWIETVKEGGAWRINQFASSPLAVAGAAGGPPAGAGTVARQSVPGAGRIARSERSGGHDGHHAAAWAACL